MTFQNKFDTIYFIMLESFDFFSNNFWIFAPVAPLKWLNQTPLGPLIIFFIDIGRKMVA